MHGRPVQHAAGSPEVCLSHSDLCTAVCCKTLFFTRTLRASCFLTRPQLSAVQIPAASADLANIKIAALLQTMPH